MPCQHEHFKAHVRVNRLTEQDRVVAYTADIRIHCVDCGMWFSFPNAPGVSPDGRELSVPIVPDGTPRRKVAPEPGFTLREFDD